MDPYPAARLIFYIVASSYVVSGGLLWVARAKGQPVAAWVIGAWLATGLIGLGLTWAFAPGRGKWVIWAGLLAVLGPWMAYSLVGDWRGGHWVIAALDVGALGAIAYALWITA